MDACIVSGRPHHPAISTTYLLREVFVVAALYFMRPPAEVDVLNDVNCSLIQSLHRVRHRDPAMSILIENRHRWRHECWVGERADRNRNNFRRTTQLKENGRAAARAKTKRHTTARITDPHILRAIPANGDGLPSESGLLPKCTPGASLTGQAVTHRNAYWRRLGAQGQLAATTACIVLTHHAPLNRCV